ncbi:MAG: energy transducer TonB, partial [Bradyrhizobium sp.]
VQQSSGDTVFDDAAVAMVRRSDPVPAPPAGLTDDQLSFALDVNFNKRK